MTNTCHTWRDNASGGADYEQAYRPVRPRELGPDREEKWNEIWSMLISDFMEFNLREEFKKLNLANRKDKLKFRRLL